MTWELETEEKKLLNEKIKEVKNAEAKARQLVNQALSWRGKLFEDLKREKEAAFEEAKREAKREVEEYSQKIKSKISKEIDLLEEKEKKKESALEKKVRKNFSQAVKEAVSIFLRTYGD